MSAYWESFPTTLPTTHTGPLGFLSLQMVCGVAPLLILCVLMQHHSPSGGRDGGHTYIASATSKSSVSSKAEGSPGNVHTPESEQIDSQKSSDVFCLDINDGLQGVSRSTGAGLLQNFSWDALARPPGSASQLTTLEDEVEGHNQHSVKPGRKRSHYDEDDKETSSSKCYECRFCTMKFRKSQALGGHMNRHKQERQNESWNRAFQLIQQGNPSTILPGHDQVLSSHSRFGPYHMQGSHIPFQFGTTSGVVPCRSKEYGVGRSHAQETIGSLYDGREYVSSKSQISAMPTDAYSSRNSDYFNARSQAVPVMGEFRTGLDFWNQPPLSSTRLSTQGPLIANNTAGFVESNSLRINTPRVFPHGRYLSLSAPREIAPQNYTHTPSLPETRISEQVLPAFASMQPEISHVEAVFRAPAYPCPIDGVRESTSLNIAGQDISLSRIGALDDSQDFCFEPSSVHANSHSSSRAVAFDSKPLQERTLIGGPDLAMNSSNATPQTGTMTGARRSTTSTSAEYEYECEGGWKENNLH